MSYVETKVTRGWELDRESLARLLGWLDHDPDRAGVEYVKIQKRLSEFFAARHCPEYLAEEVLNRIARKLAEGAVSGETPRAYIFGVARLVALEDYRKPERKTMSLDESDTDRLTAGKYPPPERDNPRHECFDRCLGRVKN